MEKPKVTELRIEMISTQGCDAMVRQLREIAGMIEKGRTQGEYEFGTTIARDMSYRFWMHTE